MGQWKPASGALDEMQRHDELIACQTAVHVGVGELPERPGDVSVSATLFACRWQKRFPHKPLQGTWV